MPRTLENPWHQTKYQANDVDICKIQPFFYAFRTLTFVTLPQTHIWFPHFEDARRGVLENGLESRKVGMTQRAFLRASLENASGIVLSKGEDIAQLNL
jgi:hypothetical protein